MFGSASPLKSMLCVRIVGYLANASSCLKASECVVTASTVHLQRKHLKVIVAHEPLSLVFECRKAFGGVSGCSICLQSSVLHQVQSMTTIHQTTPVTEDHRRTSFGFASSMVYHRNLHSRGWTVCKRNSEREKASKKCFSSA